MTTFVPPTAQDLIARYPAFADVDPATVQAVLADALLDVGESWIPAHRGPAILALAAHLLVMEGALTDSDVVAEVGTGGGALIEKKAGDHMLRFARTDQSEVVEASGFARTAYGRRFLELRARSFPAVAVI